MIENAAELVNIFPLNIAFSPKKNCASSTLYAAFLASLLLHILLFARTNSVAFSSPPALRLPTGRVTAIFLPPSTKADSGKVSNPSVAAQALPVPSLAAALSIDTQNLPVQEPETTATQLRTPIADYYRWSELTNPAKALVESDDLPQPVEPINGRAELTLLLGEDGAVEAVLTKGTSFPSDYQTQLEEFFSKMKFHPGLIDGKPRKSRFEIEVSTSTVPEIIESRSIVEETAKP